MNEDVREAVCLSDAFNLLAVLTQYPTVEVVEGAIAGALATDVTALADELRLNVPSAQEACNALREYDADGLLTDMRISYTALFDHPETPAVPLYEEQYLFSHENGLQPFERQNRGQHFGEEARPRLFVNPASLDALRQYRAAGMSLNDERRLPPDAMPIQMEFCALLYLRLSEALLHEDEEKIEATREAIEEFSSVHLRKWMCDFYGDCARHAKCDAHRAMGYFGAALGHRLGLE